MVVNTINHYNFDYFFQPADGRTGGLRLNYRKSEPVTIVASNKTCQVIHLPNQNLHVINLYLRTASYARELSETMCLFIYEDKIEQILIAGDLNSFPNNQRDRCGQRRTGVINKHRHFMVSMNLAPLLEIRTASVLLTP